MGEFGRSPKINADRINPAGEFVDLLGRPRLLTSNATPIRELIGA